MIKKKNLIIFGAGNQSNVVTKLIEKKYKILGYFVTKKQKKINLIIKKYLRSVKKI